MSTPTWYDPRTTCRSADNKDRLHFKQVTPRETQVLILGPRPAAGMETEVHSQIRVDTEEMLRSVVLSLSPSERNFLKALL